MSEDSPCFRHGVGARGPFQYVSVLRPWARSRWGYTVDDETQEYPLGVQSSAPCALHGVSNRTSSSPTGHPRKASRLPARSSRGVGNLLSRVVLGRDLTVGPVHPHRTDDPDTGLRGGFLTEVTGSHPSYTYSGRTRKGTVFRERHPRPSPETSRVWGKFSPLPRRAGPAHSDATRTGGRRQKPQGPQPRSGTGTRRPR